MTTRAGARSLVPLVALLWGLQFAFLNPAIGLLLAGLYEATPRQVGWALGAYNLSGFLSTLVVPSRADRRGDYLRPMLGCGILTVLLVTALALATSLLWAVLALVALGGPAGVGVGLLFAHQRASGAAVSEIMRTRAVFSFAWVAGPPVAALLLGLLGQRSVLWCIAGIALLAILVTQRLRRIHGSPARRTDDDTGGTSVLDALRSRRVLALVGGLVLLAAANNAAVSTTTLYVTRRLGVDVVWGGVVLATAAALEIPLLLLLGRLARTRSGTAIVAASAVAAAVYYAVVAATTSLPVLLVAQLLNALAVAGILGIGLTVVQDVVPRPGLASGLFMNTTRIGAVLAGPVIATGGSGGLGYAGVFAIAAGLALVGAALVVASSRPGRARPG